MILHTYPDEVRRSDLFSLQVNGQPVAVLHTAIADFASWEVADGEASALAIQCLQGGPAPATLHPLNRGLKLEAGVPGILHGVIPGAQDLCVRVGRHKPLYLYISGPEADRPLPGAPGVHFFAAGQVHDAGCIQPRSGETVYLEAGAVVQGRIHAWDAEGVTVRGRGVLDGTPLIGNGDVHRGMVFENCRHVTVRDLIMINPASWMVVLGACEHALVERVRQLGEVLSSDGVDICGSRHVRVRGCCMLNNDDCVVVKSIDLRHQGWRHAWTGEVDDILVEGCIMSTLHNGFCMEIGHELLAERIRGITFRDNDVLACNGFGGPISINCGDRATVEAVLYEDIRVEHYYDRLLSFRIIKSRYNRDERRGQIRDVTLRRLRVSESPYNAGYSIALMGGWDAAHTIENIRFEDCSLGGRPILRPEDIDLYQRHTRAVSFA